MGDLSKHFSRKEFECRLNGKPHGCGAKISLRIVHALENCRADPRVKFIRINSGCRCMEHPESVKRARAGKAPSYHSPQKDGFCHAADIVVFGHDGRALSLKDQYEIAGVQPVFRDGGIGIYPDWHTPGLHVDDGPCRRWTRKRGVYTSGIDLD